MLDLNNLSEYKENNRLEAKTAKGGLPLSIWNTYSAFANTDGGIILLGLKEKKDKTFEISGVENADKILKEFWDTINNRNKVSRNLLREDDVYTNEIDGNTIIIIEVPRALREQRPVYIGENIFSGSFRRNWEGDYRLSKEEVSAIFRDAGEVSQDRKVLLDFDKRIFCQDSIKGYRQIFKLTHDNHIWNKLNDEDFLCRIGAASFDENRILHPTCAGLLMFGYEYDIVREYPNYFLDYQEHYDSTLRWSDRIISSSGDWSGNIFDFFFKITSKLEDGIKRPFKLEGIIRIDDTSVHKAVREALVNCLVHGDYYGRQGTVIKKYADKIIFSNPGLFRIPVPEAMTGGVSDPRNSVLLKLFSFLDLGERAGSGVPKIVDALKETFGTKPVYSEKYSPDRTEMIFYFDKKSEKFDENREILEKNYGHKYKYSSEKFGETKGSSVKSSVKIVDMMKRNSKITLDEIADTLFISKRAVEKQVQKLRESNKIIREGGDKGGYWVVLQTEE